MKGKFIWPLLLLLPFLAAGAQAQHTGLLIVDIQEFYFPGGKAQLENPEQAGMNAGLLLERFRQEGLPVYHVRHNFEPGGDIHPFVKPLADERVFSKDHVNAFLETGLEEALEEDSISRLVICGMQTHMCVEAAVRAAADMGYDCILVQDACATRALQYDEHIINANSVHFSTLLTLKGTYARVVNTADLLREFKEIIKD
jgi:nicotinamidase-related amidase